MADKSCEVKKKKEEQKEKEPKNVVREEHVHAVNNHKRLYDNTLARETRSSGVFNVSQI